MTTADQGGVIENVGSGLGPGSRENPMLNKLTVLVRLSALAFLLTAATATAEAGDPGMVVVANGGGSIQDALFNTDATSDATFSLSAGYDKHGKLKGHFFFKRVYPGSGVRAVVSTEITDIEINSIGCPWVRMTGMMTHHANWAKKPIRNEKFEVEAWDCDEADGAPDLIWFRITRANDRERPALTLKEPTELAHGNISIH